jgi:hypothetical protein
MHGWCRAAAIIFPFVVQCSKDLAMMTLDGMLTLWTMQERFNPDSKFKIYFDTLSENFNTGISVTFL